MIFFFFSLEGNGQQRESKKQIKTPLLVVDTTSATAFI